MPKQGREIIQRLKIEQEKRAQITERHLTRLAKSLLYNKKKKPSPTEIEAMKRLIQESMPF